MVMDEPGTPRTAQMGISHQCIYTHIYPLPVPLHGCIEPPLMGDALLLLSDLRGARRRASVHGRQGCME